MGRNKLTKAKHFNSNNGIMLKESSLEAITITITHNIVVSYSNLIALRLHICTTLYMVLSLELKKIIHDLQISHEKLYEMHYACKCNDDSVNLTS